jgi:hypothetical protein
MAASAVKTTSEMDWNAVRAAWTERVQTLFRDVRRWAEEQGWHVTDGEVELHEYGLGTYSMPMLTIDLPEGRVIVEPAGRLVFGAGGRVDIYSWPSMDRVLLLDKVDTWVIRPELGPSWPFPWGKEGFLDLAKRLAADE